jgi:hypothetical protein
MTRRARATVGGTGHRGDHAWLVSQLARQVLAPRAATAQRSTT